METQIDEVTPKKMLNDGDGVFCAKGVKTDASCETASQQLSIQVSQSVGDNTISNQNPPAANKSTKSLVSCSGKFESGSGSGDPDGTHQEDSTDNIAKKRKTRRGKPKHRKMKPYSKQRKPYSNQMPSRSSRNRLISRLKSGRQFPAPYNTTQFLMDDHSDLPDLEQKLSEAAASDVPVVFQKPPAPTRTRDSSFSVDSDENYFYSSPEDEEEFLTKEFSTAYEDLHAERLNSLSKQELIQEYIQLEAKLDLLTKRFRNKSFYQNEDRDPDISKTGTMEIDASPKRIKHFQQRIDDLMQQNEQLRRENEMLRTQIHASADSSIDSESDSDSSIDDDHSQCSCPDVSPNRKIHKNRSQNGQKKSGSSESSSSDKEYSDSSQSESATPSSLANGHIPPNAIDGLPT